MKNQSIDVRNSNIFDFIGGLVLTAGTATATIPTAALLAGKAIVIKGLLLNQLLAEQA